MFTSLGNDWKIDNKIEPLTDSKSEPLSVIQTRHPDPKWISVTGVSFQAGCQTQHPVVWHVTSGSSHTK